MIRIKIFNKISILISLWANSAVMPLIYLTPNVKNQGRGSNHTKIEKEKRLIPRRLDLIVARFRIFLCVFSCA